MRCLDLFSGIGGFSLGLERAGMETVAFCEQDKFCQKVLKKHWPDVPIFDDVKELTYEKLREDGILADSNAQRHPPRERLTKTAQSQLSRSGVGRPDVAHSDRNRAERIIEEPARTIDIICAGFPCQPFSIAGRREGSQDKKGRDLWPDLFRIIQEVRPRFFIGENVQGFIGMEMGLTRTLVDLEEKAGYELEVFLLGACSVGAPHKRLRCFIVAHLADSDRHRAVRHQPNHGARRRVEQDGQDVADSSRKRLQGAKRCGDDAKKTRTRQTRSARTTSQCGSDDGEYRATQLSMGQSTDGISERLSRSRSGINFWDGDWERGVPRVATGQNDRVNKLRALGNSVVPQIVEVIARAIMTQEKNKQEGE